MARPLRIELADGVYHVMSRGLERRPIVRDDVDRHKWTELLGRTASRRGWRVFAWALLDNHFHLFLQTPTPDLSAGMHDIISGYASFFNVRRRRLGPLFQGRFRAVLVEREYHYWELTRYVHLNPVRAGLATQPERYEWSSCRWYFRGEGAPDWLAWEDVLREHGRSLRAARGSYKRFMAEGLAGSLESPLSRAIARTLLGSPGFVERMRRWVAARLPDREVPAARTLRQQVGLGGIERETSAAFGVPASSLRVRGRHGNEARRVAIYLARALTAAPVTAIGRHFGGVGGQAISNTMRQVERRLARDRAFARKVGAIEEKCRMTT